MIWVIGYIFVIGLIMAEADKMSAWEQLWVAVVMLIFWPSYLGFFVYEIVHGK